MPDFGSQFVNYSDWLKLNQPDAQRMAQAVAGDVSGQGQGAQDALAKLQTAFGVGNDVSQRLSETAGYGDVLNQTNNAQANANLLGTQGGIGQLLAQHYGGQANRFDAALAGAGAGNTFANLQQQYGQLSNALGSADQNSYLKYQWAHRQGLPTGAAPAAATTPTPLTGYQKHQANTTGTANSGVPGAEGMNPYTYSTGAAGANSHAYQPNRAGRRNINDYSSSPYGYGGYFGSGGQGGY